MTIDVQALLRSAFKSCRVLSLAIDEDGSIDALLVDAGGEMRSLTVSAPIVKEKEPDRPSELSEQDRWLQSRVMDPKSPIDSVSPDEIVVAPAPDQTKPSPATALYEERRQAARAGTTMAKKKDFTATFEIIRKADDKMSNEARGLFAELARSELYDGDDELLMAVARAARGGNEAPLRDLVERRRRPGAPAPPS